MDNLKKTKVSLYKLNISHFIKDEFFYVFYIQRRDFTIYSSRWYMTIVLKEKDLEKINNIEELKKSHLYLNPLPMFNYYDMGEHQIKWEKLGEKEINIDLIEDWAFKSTASLGTTGMAEKFLDNDWDVSLEDSKYFTASKYFNEWYNLEFANLYNNTNLDFRVALEYCRVNKLSYEKGIKNFNRKFKDEYEDGFLDARIMMERILYNTVYVDIYQNLPDTKKGICDFIPKDVEYYSIDVEKTLASKDEWQFDLFFNIKGSKIEDVDIDKLLTFQINDKLQPIDRGEIYEDEFIEFLEKKGYGFFSGGGTSMSEDGSINYIELEVELYSKYEEMIPEIITKLENLGAPKGSKLYISGKKRAIKFGKQEVTQIVINKNDFSPKKIVKVYTEIKKIMKDPKEINRIFESKDEVKMYFHGDTYRDMKKRIVAYLKEKGLDKDVSIMKVS